MQTFFKRFPPTVYLDDSNKRRVLTDITTSFILKEVENNRFFNFQRYQISDAESPQSVALKLYKDPEFHWVLLIANNIIDPFHDWPLSSNELEAFVEAKYQDGRNGIHHFYDTALDRMCDEVDEAKYRADIQLVPAEVNVVTNIEYEIEENNNKRDILIINPLIVRDFVRLVEVTLREANKEK